MAGLFGGGCVWDKRGEGTTGEKYADLHTTVGKDINLTEAITRAGIFEPDYTISFAHEVTAAKTLDMAHVAVQQLSYAARFFRVIIGKDVRLTAPNVYNIPILPSDDIETFFIIGRILKYQAGKSTSKKVIRTVVPVFDSANVEPNVKSGDGAGGPGGRPLRGGFSDGNHSGSSGHSTSGTSNSGKSRNGKYVVGEFLGSGSTFAVWQIGMGDFDGVIKAEIRGGAAVVEAYVLRQLNGIRGVPKLVDEVYYDGVPAVVVSPRGKRLGSADHSSVMDMIVNLLRTLRDVHGRGIVCNDVSLENIVVAESSSDSAVESDVPAKTYVLVDWGFATPAYSTSFNPNPPCHPVFASPRLFTEYPIVRAPADDIVSVFLVAAKMVQSVLPWEVDRGEGWSQNQRLNLKGAEIFVDGALAEGYDWALSLGRVGGTVIDYDAFIRSLTVL
ncbi:hypothetical protein HK097_000357 [Rhizophlyctis rosea]|uniref:Protein kinase domain-containing protein n=1 Tax=Rhizophlyctis rosea TaxID=64517 RepID=A0AAD5WZJ5_9FUNG|nr:hypothetical protein HK097_000357 [Rhizophlyctis rosea]